MLLTIADRFLLMAALPPQGDFSTVKIVRLLREKLTFKESEHDDYKIVIGTGGTVTWDESKDAGVTIDLTPMETKMVVDALQKLDTEKKLTIQHVPLYEKVFPARSP